MKEVEWSVIHDEGEIICECDQCGEQEAIDFYKRPDFREAQDEIEKMGWVSCRINGEWKDFCTMTCRNTYVKENL